MDSSPAPTTPDNAPRRIAMNRSFTVPARISSASKPTNASAEIGATENIETLYVHPNAKIIKFTTSSSSSSSSRPSTSSSSPARPQSSSGTLPWSTSTETTIAVGQLEIYRVPGSCSFLRSGSVLKTVMPKSPCWCVDGVSKFVLRVSPDTYNRIELPGETEEDLERVEKFKITLQKVLGYERTPCPFARTFSVDLPEEPEVKKRRRKSTGPAKKWKLHGVWRPEDWDGQEGRGSEDSRSASESSTASEDESEPPLRQEEAEVAESTDEVKHISVTPSMRSRALAALRSVSSPQQPTLSKVSPSRLRTRLGADGRVEVSERVEADSRGRETRSLRTFQAIPTDMPPSPPDSSAGVEYIDNRAQSEGGAADLREIEHKDSVDDDLALEESPVDDESSPLEEQTVNDIVEEHVAATEALVEQPSDIKDEDHEDLAAPPPQPWVQEDLEAPEKSSISPALQPDVQDVAEAFPKDQRHDDDGEERPTTPEEQMTAEDPYAAIQARILARRSIGGTTSFYPGHKSPTRQSTSSTSSTATLASNKSAVSQRSQSSQRQQAFASAMVKKACSVFLGPPAHLVAIMLKIAARFANGAFGVDSVFYVESPINSPRKVPGSYHLQGDNVDELDSDWEEDDFGVPLRSPHRLTSVDGLRERRGWDVD